MSHSPTRFSDVDDSRLYPICVVAGLFRVSDATVRRWIRVGRLTAIHRESEFPARILGSEILRLLGSHAARARDDRESRADRRARAAADFRQLREERR